MSLPSAKNFQIAAVVIGLSAISALTVWLAVRPTPAAGEIQQHNSPPSPPQNTSQADPTPITAAAAVSTPDEHPPIIASENIPPSPTGKKMIGGPNGKLEDLPACNFTTALTKLPPAARARALAKLEKRTFPIADLASLRVDCSGGIYYVCRAAERSASESPNVALAPPVDFNPTAPVPTSLPLPAALTRHSLPGCPRVIYLDFTGGVIQGTAWDTIKIGPNAFIHDPIDGWDCKPYDIDGDLTTFSVSEQILIVRMWERVAEDYAPFSVDVTTEKPAAWTNTTAHALITDTIDKKGIRLPHYGSGGIAYIDVFGDSSLRQDFPQDLPRGVVGSYSPAWVEARDDLYSAEAASHEIGHNLGLGHDGTINGRSPSDREYYSGHAVVTGNAHSWGPIMGGGNINDMSQWSKGEYFDANNDEDDLAIISRNLPYRDDQAANNIASATDVFASGGAITQNGIIEKNSDIDIYRLMCGPGPGTISLTASTYKLSPNDWGTNLDIDLSLIDANGVVVASSNPDSDPDANLTYTLSNTENTVFFVKIAGSGTGTPLSNPPTGYTAYGSIGKYTLTGNFPPATGLTITSPSRFRVSENQTAVGTITAVSTSGTPTLAVVGGADAALFTFNPTTGALAFISAPDFEAPADVGRDQTYEIAITATAGGLSQSANIAVEVQNLPDTAPPASAQAGKSAGGACGAGSGIAFLSLAYLTWRRRRA